MTYSTESEIRFILDGGPVVNDVRKRPVPDIAQMILDLKAGLSEAKATKKVKARMRDMLWVVRQLGDMLPSK